MSRLAPVALVAGAFLSTATTDSATGDVGPHPKRVSFDERIEDREQLSHGGGQGDFLEFPGV